MKCTGGHHINPGPRRDGGPFRLDPEKITGKMIYDPKERTFKLKIRDSGNAEFWLDIIIEESDFEQITQRE